MKLNATRTIIVLLVLLVFSSSVLPSTAASQEAFCTIDVAARQAEGYVSGTAYLYKLRTWKEAGLQKEEWDRVDDYSLSQGTRTLHVVPGTYYVSLFVGGTRHSTMRFALEGTSKKALGFDVSTIGVAARQAEGYVSGTVYLYKLRTWNEAGLQKEAWDSVDDYGLSQGTRTLHVVPGTYYVSLKVQGLEDRVASGELRLTGRGRTRVDFDAATLAIDYSSVEVPDDSCTTSRVPYRLQRAADQLELILAECRSEVTVDQVAAVETVLREVRLLTSMFQDLPEEPTEPPGPEPGTQPPARSANLHLVVTTNLTGVFSLARQDLVVTIDGPVTQSQMVEDVATATPVRVDFLAIPAGTYQVSATYGDGSISKKLAVSGTTMEFQMMFP